MAPPSGRLQAAAGLSTNDPLHAEMVSLLIGAAADTGVPQLALLPREGTSPTVAWTNTLIIDLLGLGGQELLGNCLPQLGGSLDVATIRGGPDDWRAVTARLIIDPSGPGEGAVYRDDAPAVNVQVEATEIQQAGWVIALRPIKDADEAAREVRHQFLALAEHAPIGIVMSEAGARLNYVNRRFQQFTGMKQSQLLGTGWLSVVHPDDLSMVNDALLHVLSGEPSEHTVRLQPAGKPHRWVTLRLAPVTTPRRSAGFIGTAEDVTARRAWEDQLTYQATHDPLTGLANRRSLSEVLTRLLRDRRAPRDFAVAYCDLDGFKQINDIHGHDIGDRVLIEVAARLNATARTHDLVTRLAGDEFVVILDPIRDAAAAAATADRLLAALTKPLRIKGIDLHISASIGLAMPDADATPDALLRTADHNMYRAKATRSPSIRPAAISSRSTTPGTPR